MRLKLEARPAPSRAMRYLSPLLAAALTIVVGFVVFSALGQNPLAAFHAFFVQPLSSTNGVAELLLKAAPLMMIATGLAVGFRANVWNIGAEGQLIVGAIFGGGVALHMEGAASSWLLAVMVLAGALGGMVWAAIPAFLRTRFNASEILTSLMLTYVAALLLSYLVHDPWRDPQGFNFPQSKMFDDALLFPILVETTRLNASFLVALAVVAAGWVFINKSFLGYQMRVAGLADAAARYAGFSATRTVWIGMLAGGGAAGIAGLARGGGADRAAHAVDLAGLRLRGDHRGVRRTPQSGRMPPREPADVAALSRRRAGADGAAPAVRDHRALPGDAALLPARRRRPDQLPAARGAAGPRDGASDGDGMMDVLVPILVATLAAGTPLVFAALGELVVEKSGVLNLGVEGMMLCGAIAGFAATVASGSIWIGVLAGMAAGAATSLVFAVLTLTLQANQVAAGLALSIFGVGLSAFVGKPFESVALPSPQAFGIPGLADIPLARAGALRAAAARLPLVGDVRAGELVPLPDPARPGAAGGGRVAHLRERDRLPGDRHPLPRDAVRRGHGGRRRRLPVGRSTRRMWVENMTAGRGWIALALVVFATWRPGRVLVGAYLFGGVTIAQFFAQGAGAAVSSQLLSSLPYLATIVVLVLISRNLNVIRLNAPMSLGKSYHPDG